MRNVKTPRSLYLDSIFSHEDPVLHRIHAHSQKENVDYMQISAYEGRILQFLCQALKVKKAIEIGTLYGYSSLMIARALPSDGKLFTLDLSQKRQQTAKALMQDEPAGKKIQFISGQAIDSLNKLKGQGPFDMVFIDADKPSYLDYLHWSNKHLKSGGLLAADNTFLFGAVYGDFSRESVDATSVKVIKAFNQEIASGGLYTSTLIPTAEGLTVGIKK